MPNDDEDEFLKHAREDMFPKMRDSAIALTIVSDDPDPKLCVELGAAILFDKPLICVVPPGRKVSSNLRRVASVIVQGDTNDAATMQRLEDAINQVMKKDSRVKQ